MYNFLVSNLKLLKLLILVLNMVFLISSGYYIYKDEPFDDIAIFLSILTTLFIIVCGVEINEKHREEILAHIQNKYK